MEKIKLHMDSTQNTYKENNKNKFYVLSFMAVQVLTMVFMN